ncbi:MAG: hypothetical protein SPI61_00935 [Ezakiella sp.]|uniref:TDE2712 family protein n=1 Tax=Ezakiella sp. TaxID=1935205 RepID=UPI00297AA988|nr:hypothetical protein [Ezakiella sp.]MDD7731478.1 hypothetical protein [Eubacteriales bacterium]MDY6079293.1 hypothetical protein [Ezakiella sp.]
MKININTEVVEMMIFFWSSVAEKEKVAEPYIISVAERPEMKLIYDDEFKEEGVRSVLSAISNRELLNGGSKKDKRFWNNNMWMMEDLGVMQAMIDPMKQLNLQEDEGELSTKSGFDEVNVIFVPGTTDFFKVVDNNLVVNFFKIAVDIFGGTGEVTFDGKSLKDAIEEKIKTM